MMFESNSTQVNGSDSAGKLQLITTKPSLSCLIIYINAAIVGIIANAVLIWAVKNRLGNFQLRPTSSILVKYLGYLDVILCILIPIDIVLLRQLPSMSNYDFLLHPRNIVLSLESIALFVISIDRYMAISNPMSQKWTKPFIRKIIIISSMIFTSFDLLMFITKRFSSRFYQIMATLVYLGVYTIFLISLGIATLSIYTAMSVAYYKMVQHRLALLPRQSLKYSVKRDNSHNNSRSIRRESSRFSSILKKKPRSLHDNISLTVKSENNPDDDIHEEIVVHQESPESQQSHHDHHHQHMRIYMHFARILISVTLVYIISILPHLLIAWELAPFIGYGIYLLFYMNAVVNPLLLIFFDVKLRGDIKKSMQRFLRRRGRDSTVSMRNKLHAGQSEIPKE